jgi:prolyl oligopeptidase
MVEDDPFLWLEEIEGERALAWVREQNTHSLAVLEADPRYAALHAAALDIVTARDRIPYPQFLGDGLGNFWQDDQHVRGLWRRTSIAEYRTAEPRWETILDIDELAARDGANWVFHGAVCLPPEDRRCLAAVSDGGKDADSRREFDLDDRRFVEGGFSLPESKQNAGWLDQDTLLVGRDWGPGTLTASGYPYILKRLRRGAGLDQAEEAFRGAPGDVSVQSAILRDPDGAVRGTLAIRAVSFFENEYHLLTDAGPRRLPVPLKSGLWAFVAGQLVFSLQQEWAPSPGEHYPSGALVSLDLGALAHDPAAARPVLIRTPGPREAIESAASTRTRLLVTTYRNAIAAAAVYAFDGAAWRETPLPLPDNSAIQPVAHNDRDDRAFINVTGFLTPDTLWLADLAQGSLEPVKEAPARFDATGAVVEQFEAVSQDGTQIPYFVVRPRELAFDGAAPTVLYGYGGFQISLTPAYAAIAGKLWIERGGVYVIANIRGGGEFGPEWHQAALKLERQRAYDDFIAVAEDLIARRITSPRRLGIMGGSNGGLLMGVMLTRRPELFRAVVIQVPLLDMLRYHKLLAGASWIGEYGDPDQPEFAEFWRRLSPYHNLRAGSDYPEPLFVTSSKDDRVHPGHARKFAAKMASLGLPFLFYENIDGGHSAAANLQERARRHALEFTYLARKLMD